MANFTPFRHVFRLLSRKSLQHFVSKCSDPRKAGSTLVVILFLGDPDSAIPTSSLEVAEKTSQKSGTFRNESKAVSNLKHVHDWNASDSSGKRTCDLTREVASSEFSATCIETLALLALRSTESNMHVPVNAPLLISRSGLKFVAARNCFFSFRSIGYIIPTLHQTS
ncbi:hypothetical protein DFH11DRAFT_498288 [Phellopilus nigrolimitatus]|nr:hypothetical protein DFH11DRAFT_498288 [Phellopilus nigrolimitatus]